MAGVHQKGYLTSADQEISDWLVKASILGTAKTVIKLFRFGDVGVSISNSILGWFSCFFFFITVVQNLSDIVTHNFWICFSVKGHKCGFGFSIRHSCILSRDYLFEYKYGINYICGD